MSLITVLVGARTPDSAARALADYLAERIEVDGNTAFLVDASTLGLTAIVDGDATDQSVQDLVTTVDAAAALVVIAPVVRDGFAGLTRSILELLPETALAGKPVLSLSSGDAPSGFTELHRHLEPLIRAIGGRLLPVSAHVSAYDITRHACSVALETSAETIVTEALASLYPEADDTAGDPSQVDVLDAQEALRRSRAGALLIDVRSDPAVGVGPLPGAVHIHKADLATVLRPNDALATSLAAVHRDIIVVCNSERGSFESVRQLRALGYRRLAHVRGGAAEFAAAIRADITSPSGDVCVR